MVCGVSKYNERLRSKLRRIGKLKRHFYFKGNGTGIKIWFHLRVGYRDLQK